MIDDKKPELTPNLAEGKHPEVCPERLKKTPVFAAEFGHTAKRLARMKISPLLQFIVIAYNCSDESHPATAPGEMYFHIDDAGWQNDPLLNQLPNGRAAAILAVEQLLARLKAGFQ